MGQQVSTTDGATLEVGPKLVDENQVAVELEKFNLASKSGIGVHMFCFTPPKSASAAEKIYIASEVTDENDVLDVKYSEWKKKFVAPSRESTAENDGKTQSGGGIRGLIFAQPESKLKVVWSPVHRFSSGRLAMVTAKALLNQGYSMKECKPENEV